MTSDAMLNLPPTGIVVVQQAESKGEGVFSGGHGDVVHMIGHLGKADESDFMSLEEFARQGKVAETLRIIGEHILAMVPALGDVVRATGNDESGNASHGSLLVS